MKTYRVFSSLWSHLTFQADSEIEAYGKACAKWGFVAYENCTIVEIP